MLRIAVIASHPIPHFTPWYREVHRAGVLDLRVFFCCNWGVTIQRDPHFGVPFQWDVPLLDGYPHEFLPIARTPERVGFWQIDNPAVGKALDRFNPDVVQVYGYARRTNWRVLNWANRRAVPVLLYSDSASFDRASLKSLVKRAVVGYFYDRVDGALYVGDNNYEYHRRFGLPRERLFPGVLPVDVEALMASVPNPTLKRLELRSRLGIPESAFVALFCGKYIQRKRPLDLVRASGRFADRGEPTWAILVGEGSERLEMERVCRAEQISNVVLTGFVNQLDIAAYFAASDVLVVPSSHDPHPLVITEAMTFGLPIVASDRVGCIGSTDTARPGVNTIVYPCGDVEALAGAIQQIRHDVSRRERMSTASRELSREQSPAVAASSLADASVRLHALGCRRTGQARRKGWSWIA